VGASIRSAQGGKPFGGEYLVAVVGMRPRFPASSKALLERCGLLIVEFFEPTDARRAFSVVAPDVIVWDSRHPSMKWLSPVARDLLSFASLTQPRTPLIVLTTSGVTDDIRHQWHSGKALLMSPRRFASRGLASAARRLCGLPDTCCSVNRPNVALTIEQPPRHSPVTRDQ
jgi:hypothetical protein